MKAFLPSSASRLILVISVMTVFIYPAAVFAQEEMAAEEESEEEMSEGVSLMMVTEWVGMAGLGVVGGMAIIAPSLRNVKPGNLSNDAARGKIGKIAISVAVLSLSAGIMHLLLVQEHMEESYAWGVFFMFMGVSQIAYGLIILLIARRPTAVLNYLGIVGNIAFIGAFVYVRLFTPPFSPEEGPIQELQPAGFMILLIQALIVALLAFSLRSNKEIKQVVAR